MTAGLVVSLIFGVAATAAGAVFLLNVGQARDRAAGFYARTGAARGGRRNQQSDPRFWRSFGVVFLVIGLADLAAVGFALGGR